MWRTCPVTLISVHPPKKQRRRPDTHAAPQSISHQRCWCQTIEACRPHTHRKYNPLRERTRSKCIFCRVISPRHVTPETSLRQSIPILNAVHTGYRQLIRIFWLSSPNGIHRGLEGTSIRRWAGKHSIDIKDPPLPGHQIVSIFGRGGIYWTAANRDVNEILLELGQH